MSAEQEKLKNLAYQLWQDAGSPHGRDQEFWYAAEIHLKAATSAKPKAAKPKAAPKVKEKAPAVAKPAAKPKAASKAKAAAKV